MRRKKVVRRKRRVYRKRRYAPKTTMVRSLGLPKQVFTKLKYNFHRAINLTAGAEDLFEHRLNSLFDPNSSGVGDQPYYFDQWAALFQRYRVYGCKIRLTVYANSNTLQVFAPYLTVYSFADAVPSATTEVLARTKRSIRRVIGLNQQPITISQYYDLPSLACVSKREYNTAEVFQSAVTTNPSRRLDMRVALFNNDGVATISVSYYLEMTFYTKFYDNQEPTGS